MPYYLGIAMKLTTSLGQGLPFVTRLGLATRGDNHLDSDDVAWAVSRGVNYLNWCGREDGLSRYVRESGDARDGLVVAAQLKARSADEAERELDRILESLGGRLDIATYYYVEAEEEWREIVSPGGACGALAKPRATGELTLIGLTTHQRSLAARWVRESSLGGERPLDLLMVRYNAAHRGAERDVFPVADRLGIPTVCFTGLRWGKLLKATAKDPPNWSPPSAPDCYRFCLTNPSASVVLTAPKMRRELEESLTLLDDWRAMTPSALSRMRTHGNLVRRTAGEFW